MKKFLCKFLWVILDRFNANVSCEFFVKMLGFNLKTVKNETNVFKKSEMYSAILLSKMKTKKFGLPMSKCRGGNRMSPILHKERRRKGWLVELGICIEAGLSREWLIQFCKDHDCDL